MRNTKNQSFGQMENLPHITWADNAAAVLNVGFARTLFEAYNANASMADIRKALEAAGVDTSTDGFILDKSLASWFGRFGCPSRDVKVLYREVKDSDTDKDIMNEEELIASGLFVRRLKGLGLHPSVREEVLENYSWLPIEEALALAGIDPSRLGRERIEKTRRSLDVTIEKRRKAARKTENRENAGAGTGMADTEKEGKEPEQPVPDAGENKESDHAMSDDELLETGFFVKITSGIGLDPELENELYEAYPEQSIEEGLQKIGLSAAALGNRRMARLKERFDQAKAMGKASVSGTLDDAAMTDEELLATGKFIRYHAGIALQPEIERRLYVNYPDQSVREGLEKEGLSEAAIGKTRAYRIKLKLEKMGGKDPLLFADRLCSVLTEDTAAFYSRHPYIEECTSQTVVLSERFYEEASFLEELSPMKILRIFCIDPGLFTFQEREEIHQRIHEMADVPIREPSFEELMECPPVLYQAYHNRMSALEEAIDTDLEQLAGELQEMSADEKRALFLTIKGFEKDPGGRFTTDHFLQVLGTPRSTYYGIIENAKYGQASEKREAQDKADAALIVQVMEYKGFKKGSWQIYMMMDQIVHVQFGLNKIRRLMKKYGIHSGIREPNEEKRRMKEYLKGHVKDDVLKRRFRLFRPNEVRLTDVTYLTYGPAKKRAYCSAMIDPVTSKLIAINVSGRNDLDLVKETLRLCAEDPMVKGGLVHSDRGVLYLSEDFQKEIKKNGLVQSMSRLGNCWDNSPMETFNGVLKSEVDFSQLEDLEAVQARVSEYAEYYNNERHVKSRLKMTPAHYEEYLLSMSDEEWARYMEAGQKDYDEMMAESAKKAEKYARRHQGTDQKTEAKDAD